MYFSLFCFVFLCLEKMVSPVFAFLLSCCDVSEKCCFLSNKLEKTSSAFSLPAIFLSFSVLSFVFFFWKECVRNNTFHLGLFFEIPCSCFFSIFLTKKISSKTFISLFPVFFCFTFFLSTFPFCYHHFFFDHFSFVCFPCVVIFPCLSNVFLFFARIFNDHFSWFSFITLLKKSFCFWEKVQKKIIDSFLNIILFEKRIFLNFNHFSLLNCFSCMIFKNILPFCLCFQTLFWNNIFFIPLFLWKKNASKSKRFSLLCLFTSSSWFVRSLCVFSLCLLFLVVTLLIETFREKNLVSYCSPSQIFPRKIFLFLFPFSSIEEKHFCEHIHLLLF